MIINCKNKDKNSVLKRLGSKVTLLTKNLAVASESSNGEGLFDFPRKGKRVKKSKKEKELQENSLF